MDLTRYLDMFLEEAKEHLQNLNEKILELENDPEDRVIIDAIFRSAHTLKGMSATMGYNQIAELTHQMENVLHKVRSGERSLTPDVIDLFFKCLDALEGLVATIAEGGEPNGDTSHLVSMLHQAQTGNSIEASPQVETEESASLASCSEISLNDYEKHLVLEGKEKGFSTWYIKITIAPNCVMKSARSFMVFRNLEELGDIIKTSPSVQEIEEEKFEQSFHVMLLSQHPSEDIIKAVGGITEVEEPEVTMVDIDAATKQQPQVSPIPAPVTKPAEPHESKRVDASKQAAPIARPKVSPTIRVDIERLDSLMNLVGELVINKGRLGQIGHAHSVPDLNETIEQLDRISTDLQSLVMKVRMVPIEQVFNRFPRMVRDLAKDLGKEIDFIVEGKETELDRTVIDEIGDPLVHLLRNAIDHGVESSEERKNSGKPATAIVRLAAKHEGNKVVIEVDEDGKGIDADKIRQKAVEKGILTQAEAQVMEAEEAVNLIFAAGLSTAEKVTDVSGRGVGLDAVRSKIESLSGEIHIETKLGKGTKFKIHLPLTLAIIQALMVKIDKESYAVPLSFIDETTSITPENIKSVENQEVMLLRGKVLPLVRLHRLLELSLPDYHSEQELFVVVVRKGGKQIGILVDELIGQQEIVIKNLGFLLEGIPGLAGATILGDGQVSLILDVSTLF